MIGQQRAVHDPPQRHRPISGSHHTESLNMKTKTRTFAPYIVLFALTCLGSAGQEEGELIVAGPFGRPTAVVDHAGNWSNPISIYSDVDLGYEVFVSDITAPGWIQWNGPSFRQTGIYAVDLYTYFKNNRWCLANMVPASGYTKSALAEACAALRYRRRYIEVDTRRKIVKVVEDSLMTSTAWSSDGTIWGGTNKTGLRGKTPSFADLAGTPFGKMVSHITEIVERETKR